MIINPAALVSLVLAATVSNNGAAAWAPQNNHRLRRQANNRLSTTTSTQLFVVDSKESLPDYGKTTVKVDTIKLEPKTKSTTSSKWRRKDLFGSSLIDQTLQELEADEDFQLTAKRYEEIGKEGVSKEERTQRRRALTSLGVPSFSKFLGQQLEQQNAADDDQQPQPQENKPFQLQRKTPTVLQINIGLYCNQACGHCHVESSPLRTQEMMTAETAAQCLELLKSTPSITTLDITGGAPELNAHFRFLVQMARSLRPNLDIIDRCNLTVLQEPGQEDLVAFLKEQQVHIIASLPCYSQDNVDSQRGNGVFERSIAALLALNEAGYGNGSNSDSDLQLDLVYNPLGAFLPPEQSKLETQYKQELAANFGILFDQLFTITNMPIKRFADFLHRREELKDYMELLVRNFNVETVPKLMCLDMISVGWDGKIYDCDFNQQLGYTMGRNGNDGIHQQDGLTVFDLKSLDELNDVMIRNDNHCFGCTAGMGSS
jgi:radical SAM/Cys-rich protein